MKTYSLVVKCQRENGAVDIHAASSVKFSPGSNKPGALPPMVCADVENGDYPAVFDTGTVYVMNAAGKTFQIFRLWEEAASPEAAA